MCGIIGYVGHRPCKELVLAGLERLEYRGYDSAGIVLIEPDGFDRSRAVGKVEELRRVVEGQPSVATVGMGHTRWATHGGVEERNAHPFLSGDRRFSVLMNGIFENYRELRQGVTAQGHVLTSATDTEALVHLVAEHYDGDLVSTVRRILPLLHGHFAFLVSCLDEPERIVAARHAWPPLVVGVGEGETFIASFTPAFLSETRKTQHVAEDEVVEITAAGARFYAVADGALIEREIEEADATIDVAERGGRETFMLKEIYEQPEAIEATMAERVDGDHVNLDGIGLSDGELARVDRVLIVACGTALHAGLIGRYLIEEWAGVATEWDVASEWRYRNAVFDPGTLVLAISQSGETADTIAAMRLARERGARVVAITNVMGSAVTRESDGVLYTRAGLEIGVAATKTFTAQVTTLILFALRLAQLRWRVSPERSREILAALAALPDQIRHMLADDDLDAKIESIAEQFGRDRFFLFLGRHIGLPVCQEGALKLKEITYIPTDAYAAGEMKHGPIALLSDDTPVVAVATDSHVYEKVVSNLQEVRARGAQVIAIASEGNEAILEQVAHVVYVPRSLPEFEPLLAVVPLQLLAYRIARLLGLDVDKPRNLAKTVTVE